MAISAKRNQPEADFRRKVMKLAEILGYRPVHFKTSLTAKGQHLTTYEGMGKGYPDLFIARSPTATQAPRLIWAELKAGKNKLDPEQEEYLNFLRSCGAETYLWRDTDWEQVVEVLRR